MIWKALLFLVIPFYTFALDLDHLEKIVSSLECTGNACETDCDTELASRIGIDLPADAGSCQAKEQYRLLKQGLYRSTNGTIKSLKKDFSPLANNEKLELPGLHKQDVSNKMAPYIIDLQTGLKSR